MALSLLCFFVAASPLHHNHLFSRCCHIESRVTAFITYVHTNTHQHFLHTHTHTHTQTHIHHTHINRARRHFCTTQSSQISLRS
jgi:hypothetical protein